MTEEIIKSIMEAEEQGANLKHQATEKATEILAEAERQATQTLQSVAEVCRAYSETQLKNAYAEAEHRFVATLEKETQKAKEYCAESLKNANGIVSSIVGRIVRGDC
ncbi:MAG: hypothetical protein E7381_05245 [Clostridiales bacterium]|nr:hypothetical protein [Clostridiales bacterium]